MRRRAPWIDSQRLGQLRDRIVILALAIINNPKRGVHKLILWRQRRRLFQSQFSCFQFTGSEVDHPEIRERIKVVRAFRQDVLVLFLRRTIFAAIEIVFRLTRHGDQLFRDGRRGCGLH